MHLAEQNIQAPWQIAATGLSDQSAKQYNQLSKNASSSTIRPQSHMITFYSFFQCRFYLLLSLLVWHQEQHPAHKKVTDERCMVICLERLQMIYIWFR